MAPRLAPTPPTLTVNTQNISAPNLVERSASTLTAYGTRNGSKFSTPATSPHSILNPPSSQIAFASPQSSSDFDTTPQKLWHKTPMPVSSTTSSSPANRPLADVARARDQSGLRIGRERLTLSVANALEEGLGINIGDETDEDSIYGQSTEDHSADVKHAGSNARMTETRGRNWLESDAAAALETQSPLSLLMSANDPTQMPPTSTTQHATEDSPQTFRKVSPRPPTSDRDLLVTKMKGTFSTLLGDTSVSDNGIRASTGPSNVEGLKQLLDFQCSRFDRVAKHLLEIISRHETQKVQYESQLSVMKKDATKKDREIKRLQHLLDAGCSCGISRATEFFRVAPLRGALSSTTSLEDHLLGNGPVPSKSGDGEARLSCDASPLSTPMKEKRKAMTLKRSKTMPQLHGTEDGLFAPSSPSPITPSPDVSGLSLQFPIPEPLSVQSIASTILSSAPASSSSVPPLTSSTTADSETSVTLPTPLEHPARKGSQGDYFRFSDQHYTSSKATSSSDVRFITSHSYARNLNKDHGPSIERIIHAS